MTSQHNDMEDAFNTSVQVSQAWKESPSEATAIAVLNATVDENAGLLPTETIQALLEGFVACVLDNLVGLGDFAKAYLENLAKLDVLYEEDYYNELAEKADEQAMLNADNYEEPKRSEE